MSNTPLDITVLLRRWHNGDHAAGDELFRLILPELKKIAARFRNRERPNYSLQRTELVNELYSKLLEANDEIDWRNRGHFFAIYTIKLRRFLIDRARKKPTSELLSIEDLPEGIMAGRNRLEVRLAVDRLLDELEKESPTTCSILVARIYFGYEVKEIVKNFDLPQRTVERHLHDGRKWLFERLGKEPTPSGE
ncbi:MAG TPA: sigma-70 family RNA polymerase sigma factor [Candidatus Angelobacter sp.]|jgi:RNA polymerase sigma factor (TIGR02999 family)|nr:sigma-70 family RNA polymerase sigma factor [Candidatus Angelobacter sp.]